MNMEEQDPQKFKFLTGNIEKLYRLVLISYALIAILFVITLPMVFDDNDMGLKKGSIEMVDPAADRDLQAEVNQIVDENMFNVFMNTDIVFENGKAKGNLLIQNTESNKAPVLVEIYTADSNELIYKSYEIPAGYKIESAKLNKPLEKGTHKCIAYFNVLNEETKEVRNKIGLNVNITVNN